jgi:folate-binding protein YgfZ
MPNTTVLRLEGRDVLDLLHRLTTQSLLDLPPGRARATLWCDFRGRLEHRAWIAHASDGSVLVVRDDAPGADLAAAIDRQVFREDVRIEIRSEDVPVRPRPGGVGLEAGAVRERDGRIEAIQCTDSWALELGGEPAPPGPDPAVEHARIAAGLPRHGHEVRAEFHPFEVGLARDVHLDKGCYPGQEVLQRLVTYDSVRRRFVRVAGVGSVPRAPADLWREGALAGRLTSATADGDGWIGLATIKLDALADADVITLVNERPLGRVTPFPVERPLGRP